MCWPFAFSMFSSGTGIVTSVPSDAPDDIAALRDIKKKQVRLQTIKHFYCAAIQEGIYTSNEVCGRETETEPI